MSTQEQASQIRDFLTEREGVLLIITDDSVLIRALRNTITRVLGIDTDSLLFFQNANKAIKNLDELNSADRPCLVLIDRMLAGKPTTDYILTMRRLYPDVEMLVIVPQLTQDLVGHYYEMDIVNLICKPISTDILIDRLTRALEPPSSFQRDIEYYKKLIARGDADEALELIDKALHDATEVEQLLTMRGDALTALGEIEAAVEVYVKAHKSDPYYLDPLKRLSAIFRHMDDEKALGYLKKLDGVSPLNADRKFEIAQTHLRRKEQEEAKAYLDQSIEVMTQETEGQLGSLLEKIADVLEKEDPDLAGGYIEKALKSKTSFTVADIGTFNKLGIILRNQGKWKEAVETYKKAIDLDPSDPIPLYNMGLAYWRGKKHQDARKSILRALRLNPKFYEGIEGVAYNIGSIYFDLEDYIGAAPFFAHVLDLNPTHEKTMEKMEKVKAHIGK